MNIRQAFGYNARGEVASARYGTNTIADIYDYDGIGNFTSNRLDGTWTLFEANELNEYATITDTAARTLAYDHDGNLLTNGVWSYSYDSENRLTAIASNGVVIATNAYDPMSRRIQTQSAGGDTLRFYDGWNTILEIRRSAGTAQSIPFYWGKDLSGRLQGAGGVGGLLCSYENGGPHYPAYDNNGNVVAYICRTGTMVTKYIYEAFGNILGEADSPSQPFEYRFSTKSFTIGILYDYGFRFYNPSLGKWLNRDLIEEEGSKNLFSFCNNRPLFSIDLFGLQNNDNEEDQAKCCCECIDSIDIELITAEGGAYDSNQGTGQSFYGHQFFLLVKISRGESDSGGNNNAALKWNETISYGTGNPEKIEVVSERPDSEQSKIWNTRADVCEGTEDSITIHIHDYPTIEMPPPYNGTRKYYYRQVKFNFVGENSTKCDCKQSSVSKLATQTIKVIDDIPSASFVIGE